MSVRWTGHLMGLVGGPGTGGVDGGPLMTLVYLSNNPSRIIYFALAATFDCLDAYRIGG